MAGVDGNPYTPLAVDGIFGPQTAKALQWKIGDNPADGIYDGEAAGWHELYLHCTYLDRDLYFNNGSWSGDVVVLQQHLNSINIFVAVDGYAGPQTIKGVQIALNNTTY